MNGLTRREALVWLGALGSLSFAGCADPVRPVDFATSRRDAEAAARVGRAWIAAQAAPPDSEALVARLCEAGSCSGLHSEPEALRAHLAERHERDFAQGRLVSVDGWRLSETETLVCALVALSK